MTYSLDEGARLLCLHSSTIRFWEEALRKELGVPRDSQGNLCLEEGHIHLMAEIRRMILDEGRTLEEVRGRLQMRQTDRQAGDLTGNRASEQSGLQLAQHTDTQPDGQPAGQAGSRVVETSHALPALPTPVASEVGSGEVAGKVEDLSKRVSELGETIGYLVEENRALQELVGRLILYIEKLGDKSEEKLKEELKEASERPTNSIAVSGNSAYDDGDTTRSPKTRLGPNSPADPSNNPANTPALLRSATNHTNLSNANRNGKSLESPQLARSRLAANNRPRLTLAERRAEIVAQREAARAREHAQATEKSAPQPAPGSTGQ